MDPYWHPWTWTHLALAVAIIAAVWLLRRVEDWWLARGETRTTRSEQANAKEKEEEGQARD